MMKREASFRMPPGSPPETLLDFLSRRFTYHARDVWQVRLAEGRVRVNGHPALADQRLNPGDGVDYDLHDLPEPPVDDAVGVIYEDRALLALDKPGNLPCHPGGAYFNHTLWAILKERFGLREPALVNRLDRETSGLILVAKTPQAARSCRAQFASRQVDKRYRVLVEGLFPADWTARGLMQDEVGGPVRKRRRFVPDAAPTDASGEWAATRFRRLAAGGGISLVEAVPETGRLHQIRATLLALGFPVVGDKLYGTDPTRFLRFCRGGLTDDDRTALRMERQALHAASLRLRYPATERWVEWEAPLPADMRVEMQRIGLEAPTA